MVQVEACFFTHYSPEFVIPNAERDLHFAGELQIPRYARDDNSEGLWLALLSADFHHGLLGLDGRNKGW